MTSSSRLLQQGFSLIELVTVLLIITVLSTIAIRSTVDIGYSARFEQTRERLNNINRAIVGNPKRFINGLPDIGSYIDDMGRLPDSIRELFQMGYCATSAAAPRPPTSAGDIHSARRPNVCAGGGREWRWVDIPCTDEASFTETACATAGAYHLWLGKGTDATTSLSFGWDGAYLSISDSPDNDDAYTDGWGRITTDDNYGWIFNSTGSPNLTFQSYGKNQAIGGADYDEDYPAVATALTSVDWQRDLNGIEVNIRADFIGSCGNSTCSNTEYTTQTSCEINNKSWNSVDSECVVPTYPTQASCLTPYVWDTVDLRCEDLRFTTELSCESMNNSWANHDAKRNCELGGEIWTTSISTICLRVHYKTVDANGKTIITTTKPLVSPSHDVLEDGQRHIISFTGLFNDENNNGIQNVGEVNINIPIGEITVGVYEYTGGACTNTKYNGIVDDEISYLFPIPTELPIVNW